MAASLAAVHDAVLCHGEVEPIRYVVHAQQHA
jgi:hypothetical protein